MKNIISWVLRIFAAAILAQSLYFKFSGAEETVQIFTALNMEPGGRILIGVLELIAAILLLTPSTVVYGSILAWGVMSGAMIGHFTDIGFEGDLLFLFLLGVGVWLSASILLVLHRGQLPIIRHMFEKSDRSV